MGFFESFPRREAVAQVPPPVLEDFSDAPEIHSRLRRLPAELRDRHMRAIDDMADDTAVSYLDSILEQREAASKETVVSDPGLQEYFDTYADSIWESLETSVFTDTDNLIGRGSTARIKRLQLKNAPVEKMAIKYLVSPTEKTLSVSGEHDLIQEVERIRKIELAERFAAAQSIKVPHPYFYYRNGKTQCYGMEEIDGVDLERGTEGLYRGSGKDLDEDLKAQYRNVLQALDREKLMQEIDTFFDAMHTVCIHGDVKPKNIMLSRSGQFYLIDFGQSVLATDIDDKSQDAFENLKEEEKKNAKQAVRYFLDSLEKN